VTGFLTAERRPAALALVVLVALAVTAAAAPAAGGRLSFREVAQGSRDWIVHGENPAANGRVLRDAREAARVLRAWGLDAGAAASSVNFARESLIVAIAPYQPSSGYRARVSRVDVHGREAVVEGLVRYEGGELASSTLERPWVLVAVKRSALAGVRGLPRVRLRAIRRES
jgi:hypothetical protein